MMGKSNDAFQYLATTGTGIAIGTDIDFAGVFRCSDLAGTITIKAGATTLLTMSADRNISLARPLAISGPVTMTSSAGQAFLVSFRKRNV
jgi:hypothetical protein